MARYVLLDGGNIIKGVVEWDGTTQFDPPGLTKHLLPIPPPQFSVGDTYNTTNNTVTPHAETPDEGTFRNAATLLEKAAAALNANATFMAIGSPTNPQTLAQVRLLTKEVNALIRLTIRALDTIADT